MTQALALEPQIEKLARDIAKSQDVLYLGRGTNYPLALEGALKLKEISYIHAEGYAAGRTQARPDCADRREDARGRDRALRSRVREDGLEPCRRSRRGGAGSSS